ncbi:uncharacterized protein PITG_08768 [Phytophthora infestans T30-4]|uniref:Integrase catalytic domain-containing protein n=1 Tax=Phytophthora infestans (strain T30-4) TaxID=403677 RepID=D0ND61_PHYIT|nr:uncharacterized protein PITG_08768 [Phytophthora infestans T30-4]EEY56018.1 hypothetical protein PITG_08768 [Phytophthora infestans T30-4]|eukprot:XP_002902848.1 hypothetical protein PITG_08768 [Phytophthora infestans T30-4]
MTDSFPGGVTVFTNAQAALLPFTLTKAVTLLGRLDKTNGVAELPVPKPKCKQAKTAQDQSAKPSKAMISIVDRKREGPRHGKRALSLMTANTATFAISVKFTHPSALPSLMAEPWRQKSTVSDLLIQPIVKDARRHDQYSNVVVPNVFCVPSLSINWLSVYRLVQAGRRVLFDHHACPVTKGNHRLPVSMTVVQDGVYVVIACATLASLVRSLVRISAQRTSCSMCCVGRVYGLAHKDAAAATGDFLVNIARQARVSAAEIQVVRTDGGSEFRTQDFRQLVAQLGPYHQRSTRTPMVPKTRSTTWTMN